MASKTNVTRPKSLKARVQPQALPLGFQWGVMNTALLVAGVAVLLGGYLSLSRGSITLAPVLLVTGYCVLIPASLLVRGGELESGE
jgi:hypothetical protein